MNNGFEYKKVLLTGGCGFIGGALAARLAGECRVVVFDLVDEEKQRARLAGVAGRIDFVRGDVRDRDALARAADGCDCMIHLASIAGVDCVMSRPLETMEIISEGTMNALRVAHSISGLKRFINFSTSEVFGDMAFKLSEGEPTALGAVGESRWTYAVSKLMAEHLVYNYHRQHGLSCVSIRPFNIYGPGQIGEGAIHTFIRRALRGETLDIHNDGTQIRAWCYIEDLIDSIMLTMTRGEAVGNSFNIGNPRSTVTIYSLARMIKDITGSESEIRFVDWPYSDIELRVPNVAKARELLGFEPRIELEDGIARTVEWYRERTESGT